MVYVKRYNVIGFLVYTEMVKKNGGWGKTPFSIIKKKTASRKIKKPTIRRISFKDYVHG